MVEAVRSTSGDSGHNARTLYVDSVEHGVSHTVWRAPVQESTAELVTDSGLKRPDTGATHASQRRQLGRGFETLTRELAWPVTTECTTRLTT